MKNEKYRMKNDYSVSFAFAEATQSLRSFGVKELFFKKYPYKSFKSLIHSSFLMGAKPPRNPLHSK